VSAAAAVEAVWGLPQDMPKHEGQQACKQTGLSNSFSSKRKVIEVFKGAATVTSNAIVCKTVAWLLVGHLPLLMCVSTAPCCLPLKRAARRSRYAPLFCFCIFFLHCLRFRFRSDFGLLKLIPVRSLSLFFVSAPPNEIRFACCLAGKDGKDSGKSPKESEKKDMICHDSRFGVLLLGFGFRHELPNAD
jgi:hypothetical protein